MFLCLIWTPTNQYTYLCISNKMENLPNAIWIWLPRIIIIEIMQYGHWGWTHFLRVRKNWKTSRVTHRFNFVLSCYFNNQRYQNNFIILHTCTCTNTQYSCIWFINLYSFNVVRNTRKLINQLRTKKQKNQKKVRSKLKKKMRLNQKRWRKKQK